MQTITLKERQRKKEAKRPPLLRASCRIRTNDPEITNHVLWPTELKRQTLAAITAVIACVGKRLQRYGIYFIPTNILGTFLFVSCFFLKFGKLNLHSINTFINTFFKGIACLFNKESIARNCHCKTCFLI